jgi:hypothetical protein
MTEAAIFVMAGTSLSDLTEVWSMREIGTSESFVSPPLGAELSGMDVVQVLMTASRADGQPVEFVVTGSVEELRVGVDETGPAKPGSVVETARAWCA